MPKAYRLVLLDVALIGLFGGLRVQQRRAMCYPQRAAGGPAGPPAVVRIAVS